MNERDDLDATLALHERIATGSFGTWRACILIRLEMTWRLFFTRW